MISINCPTGFGLLKLGGKWEVLRAGGLETTSPQSKWFAGARRLVFLAMSGVTSSSISRAGVFQAAKMGCKGWECRSSMGSIQQGGGSGARTGSPRSLLQWLARHLIS